MTTRIKFEDSIFGKETGQPNNQITCQAVLETKQCTRLGDDTRPCTNYLQT